MGERASGRRRWGWRRPAAGVAAAVVAVGATWAVTRPGDADDRIMVVDAGGGVSLLDPESGDVAFRLDDASVTPDRSALLTTEDDGDGTILRSHDPDDGEVTGSTRLPGSDLTVRTVSPQGTAVALMPGPRGAGIYEPEPRERTSIAVSFLDDRAPLAFDLEGNIEPEMFSYDESGLYVLEFVPPADPDSYYVRRLDLATGELADTGAPQVGLNPRMRGKARSSVMHPDGDQLFTLYTLPADVEPFDPAEPGGRDGDEPLRAFIHVINLRDDWSYCIFLPLPIGSVEEATVGMGISPDGERLLVADPSTATVATVDTTDLTVTGTTTVPQFEAVDGPQARVAMAEDGTVYLGAGSELLELGPDLVVTRAWSQVDGIDALSISASGDRLRVGGGGRITILDRASGAEVGVLRPPGDGVVSLLGPPQGSVTQFPLECAC